MARIIAFDFAARRIETVAPGEVAARIAAGGYCWLDVSDPAEAPALLAGLGIGNVTIDRVMADTLQGQFSLGRHSIHATLVETRLGGGELMLSAIQLVLGEGFLVTVHAAPSSVLDAVRASFEEDFDAAAESGGFLLFEVADHLTNCYRETLAELSHRVDAIQQRLLGDVGDEILAQVSDLTRSLLDYRNAIVGARETIHELSTRRSAYVSASTQPFLERQTISLDRLAGDASTERVVLSEVLALYMGIVSHRTSKVVNRLTVISMVFLPLNFLAAVYGMNFEHMPELGWRWGYFGFWGVSVGLALVLLASMRRWRWF